MLRTFRIDDLAEIAFLVEEPDPDCRHIEVARGLEEVARKDAKAACIERQRLAKPKLHAEIGNLLQHRYIVGLAEPPGAAVVGCARCDEGRKLAAESGIAGEFA